MCACEHPSNGTQDVLVVLSERDRNRTGRAAGPSDTNQVTSFA
jgi:hypothetical protein